MAERAPAERSNVRCGMSKAALAGTEARRQAGPDSHSSTLAQLARPARVRIEPLKLHRDVRGRRTGEIHEDALAGGTMANPQMVMYEEEFNRIQTVVDRLVKDASAKVVFIVDKNGQLIAASGDVDNLDTTSLASLTAGNIAATGGMAKLLKENEFATQFHEGEKANIHIQLVGNRVILVVIFDSKSSLGLVRLRVRKASEELNHIFEALLTKVRDPGADSPFAEITDEDIDNLFND
jgi:predicted regulator of Ras-like GTPase activity (Roadblock/LC7/MglB family)